MNTEIIKIIEGGLQKDRAKVIKFAHQLSLNQRNNGDTNLAKRINNLLNANAPEFVTTDDLSSRPVDSESRLEMIQIASSLHDSSQHIFSNLTQNKINNFIEGIRKKDQIQKYNINLNQSLLLYGPPGCGKSTIANYISYKLDKPLIVARLDTMMSSLLGNTAKNIKKIFSFASSKPCILFLDEFDAIAKARDDQNELGELKRVVNSLIQNIDDFIENNILIAATNHHELLDKAIWRRFSSIIYVDYPGKEEREKILELYLGNFPNDFLRDSKKLNNILELIEKFSPADLKNLCSNAIKNNIIQNNNILVYSDFLIEIIMHKELTNINENKLINFLSENGVTQEAIKKSLNISMRQVRKHLNENG